MTRARKVKGGEGQSSRPRPVLLALGTGLLLFLSFPGTVGFWPAAWVALVPLLLALRLVRPGAAAGLGLLAGMIHYVSLLYWITIVLGRYGNLPLWISVPALLLLALYMSSYLALFCAVICRLWEKNEILATWAAPLLWVGLDYVRSFLFSGFPWQDLGYSQYRALFLIQTADLTGHYGITFHIVLVNSVTVLLLALWSAHRHARESAQTALASRRRRAWFAVVVPVLAILLCVLTYNVVRYHQLSRAIAASPAMKVAVAQGNIAQEQKWSPAMRLETIDRYVRLSEQALAAKDGPPVLLVWPETALPFLINDNPYYRRLKKKLLTKHKVWLLSGAPYYRVIEETKAGEPQEVYSYNSAYLFSPDGEVSGRYDKQHLVPFGEYVPLSRFFSLPGPLVENIGNFSSGTEGGPLSSRDAAIGVLICFESIFPELARERTARGANLLVNITNDAWFGRSSAPWQHLSMAVFRAVENRRSLARAANTGVSAFIDPLGRVMASSPLFQSFYLVGDLPLLRTGTLFTAGGCYFGLLCLLAAVPLIIRALSRSQEEK